MAEYVDLAIARIGMAMVMADGEVNQDELETFLEGMSDFDVSPEAIKEVLESIDDDNFFETAIKDVLVIAEQGSEELKVAIWGMALELMISDGDMDKNEQLLAAAMGEAFGFADDD